MLDIEETVMANAERTTSTLVSERKRIAEEWVQVWNPLYWASQIQSFWMNLTALSLSMIQANRMP